jgi:hypothetical protein
MATHRERFLKKHNLPLDTSLSLEEISKLSGVPITALQEVYNRGTGAYSNLASVRLLKDFSKNPDTKKYPASARLSKEAWSYARVYSFVDRGTTFKTTDSDIARRYKLV